MTPEDRDTSWLTARFPDPDMSPAEFEEFVVELFEAAMTAVDDLQVTLHEKIRGVDGAYDFDATVRYQLGGMSFLVIVEAKRHSHPIKRELVQVLKDKVHSVGAHKGVLIATAPFQKGALEYAIVHGIALVKVTEGRYTFETKSTEQAPKLSREQATDLFGLPTFVGHVYGPGGTPDLISCTLVSTRDTGYIGECLLGVDPN